MTNNNDKNSNSAIVKRGPISWLILLFAILISKIFIKFKVSGLDKLPNCGSYIIAANHLSYFDGLWIMASLPISKIKKFHAIAGSDLWTDYGILGRIMMRVGSAIPLDRKGSPISGILSAKRALISDNILLIHPEGTRSHDGYLARPIHGGAALLSRRAQVPLVPVYLDGAYEIFGRHQKFPKVFKSFFRRRELIIRIMDGLDPKDYHNSREMTEKLENELHKCDMNRITESSRN